MTDCLKCKKKCVPIYYMVLHNYKQYVCRDCALEVMKGYYDRRPIETEETD